MAKRGHFNPKRELAQALTFELGGKKYEVRTITQDLLDEIMENAQEHQKSEGPVSDFLDEQLAIFTGLEASEFAAVEDIRDKRAVLQWLMEEFQNPLGR